MFALFGMLLACDQPACEELSRVEVSDSDGAFSADDLLSAVVRDGDAPASWWDGEQTLASLRIERGEGSAVQITQRRRSQGVLENWSNDVDIQCLDTVRVPIGLWLQADGMALEMSGDAVAERSSDPAEPLLLWLNQDFAPDALPMTEEDPSAYTEKSISLRLTMHQGQVLGGAVGWNGRRDLEDAVEFHAESVLLFEEVGP